MKKFKDSTYLNETAISAKRIRYNGILQPDDTHTYVKELCYDFQITRKTKRTSTLSHYGNPISYYVIATVEPNEDFVGYLFSYPQVGARGTHFSLSEEKITLPYSLDDELLEHITANKNVLERFILDKLGIDKWDNINMSTQDLHERLRSVE